MISVRFFTSTIPHSCIQLTDQWNLHPFLSRKEDRGSSLALSIQTFGVLTPLLVRAVGGDSYEIVDGRRRLDLLRQISKDQLIWCRVVTEDTAPKEIVQLLLETVLQHRSLTPIETAYLLRICQHFQLGEDTIASLFHRLSLPTHKFNQAHLLRLLHLEPHLQRGLHSGILAEQTAHELITLPAADRLAIFQLFVDLQLGGNKQKRLLTLLRDVAKREICSITALISSDEIQHILMHPETNTPQKNQALTQHLHQRATPALSKHEEKFTNWLNRLNLPPSCHVCHSQAFEKDEVSLTITFANEEKLTRFWTEIRGKLD